MLIAVVKCVEGGKERTIKPGEIEPGDQPICDDDYSPMVPKLAAFIC